MDRRFVCFSIVGLLIALASPLASAEPGKNHPTDLKDREFTADEIVRALVPKVDSTGAPGSGPKRTKRGLGVVQAGSPGSDSPSAQQVRRSVSMQLQFDFDSARLTDSALTRLDAVGTALRAPELAASRFVISGHTDSTGRYDYNLGLSKRRAEAVRDYLVRRHGISAERMLPVGKASDDLIDATNPDSAANRRVQLETME